ncbi:rod shape-determining protein MreB [Nonomuraea solani]|uniref:Rod shape-determining protein MreB n=1 Tax=Nonomuraea solani TaxID=1144553 RepID=A0A1H6E7B1_9ACTN|nr:rod shape-determining protein [Nonomuraea solani]SEG93143.1 rod shape-determining protein MreB [Nonomuraea solani]
MSLLGRDLAMDLGAASTRIYVRRRGIVLDEPSAVTVDGRTGKVIRYGTEAAHGAGGETCWPVSGGLPADIELARRMIRHFVRKVHWHPFSRPRMVMALPDDSTPIDRTALCDVVFEAEASGIVLIPHALAAALGAGLPVSDCAGSMVIDIGRDSARIAVLSRGDVVAYGAVPYGGHAVNMSLIRLVEREHGLLIDEAEAESAKRRAGTGGWITVRARDPDSGQEHALPLPVQRVHEAADRPIEAIVGEAMETVARCPAELIADLGERGAVLVGGGALLRGLDRRLRTALCMPVRTSERPLESVALGLGRCVDDLGLAGRLRNWRS